MRRVIGLFSLTVILFLGVSFVLSEKTLQEYTITRISESSLEDLRSKAYVECLSNSQCSENSECLENKCVDKNKIHFCQNIKLAPMSQHIGNNDPINKFREIFTDGTLPYLLTDGSIAAVIDGNLTVYEYVQVVKLGKKKLVFSQERPFVSSNDNKNEPLYTFRIYFSNGIDFSNDNIKGQTLRILGKEYTVGDKSTNSIVYLISNDRKIKLDEKSGVVADSNLLDNAKIRFIRDDKSLIIIIEIQYLQQSNENIPVGERYVDTLFNSIELSFESISDKNAAILHLGGYCP